MAKEKKDKESKEEMDPKEKATKELEERKAKLAEATKKQQEEDAAAEMALNKVLEEKEPILNEIMNECRLAKNDLRLGGNADVQKGKILELIKKF